MRQILIAKSTIDYGLSTATGDIAGANALDLLADGSIVCLEKDGTFVDDTTPTITQDAIYFALGRTTGGPVITPLIDIASMTYEKKVYVAPVAKAICLGSTTNGGTTYNLNIPSSPTVGTSALLTVIDETKPFDNRTREKIYEYVVKTGDTAASVAAGIIAKVNADANRIVNATEIDATNHDGFYLTAITAGNNFNVSCGGILANADVLGYKEIIFAGTAGVTAGYNAAITTATVVVANVVGTGTSAQILELERDYSTERGNTGLQDRGVSMYTVAERTVSGGTYTTYVITWTAPNDNPLIPKANMTQQLIIAAPSGDTGAGKTCAALDAILASL